MFTSISVEEGVKNHLKFLAERFGVSLGTIVKTLVYLTQDPYVYAMLSNIIKAQKDHNRNEIGE